MVLCQKLQYCISNQVCVRFLLSCLERSLGGKGSVRDDHTMTYFCLECLTMCFSVAGQMMSTLTLPVSADPWPENFIKWWCQCAILDLLSTWASWTAWGFHGFAVNISSVIQIIQAKRNWNEIPFAHLAVDIIRKLQVTLCRLDGFFEVFKIKMLFAQYNDCVTFFLCIPAAASNAMLSVEENWSKIKDLLCGRSKFCGTGQRLLSLSKHSFISYTFSHVSSRRSIQLAIAEACTVSTVCKYLRSCPFLPIPSSDLISKSHCY